jgi:peptidoglycan/LPS O-acetylase OafA/YrhL
MSMSAAAKPLTSGKVLYVETLRGIACILLVSYHVIGDTGSNGLQLASDHPYSLLNRLFVDLRMPLFSFISGYVFSAFARDAAMLQGKIWSKARRLLLPMAVVGTLHYWTQFAFAADAGDQPPFLAIFILPYEHFWYLQATFVLMVVVFLVTYLMKGDGVRAAWILLVPTLVGSIILSRWSPDVFSAYKALYLAPYFLTGYLIAHAAPVARLMDIGARERRVLAAVSVLLLALFTMEFLLQDGVLALDGAARRAFGAVVGLVSCLAFFLYRIESRILAFIGDHSYAIFLLHVFFTAGSRIVLTRVLPGIPVEVLFLIGLTAGVVGPICVAWLALRHPVSALLLLGIRRQPAKRAAADRAQTAH